MPKPHLFLLAALLACSLGGADSSAAEFSYRFQVAGGSQDRKQTPVVVPLAVPEGLAEGSVNITSDKDLKLVGQLTQPALLHDPAKTEAGQKAVELNFVLPELKAGETLSLTATISDAAPTKNGFAWKDMPKEQHTDLLFGERPVLRYMYAPVDNSSPETRGATYKPYHHVFDPQGKRLVTKGPGGLFPHHRGLYFGFNKISYEQDGKKMEADTWHNNKGEWTEHEKFVSSEAGPVLGRHRLQIAWHGRDGAVFATELREMTAWNTAGGTLIEFASRLESKVGTIALRGDPQHAGFQFRASQDVPDKTAKQTYYLRPDGKGEPGKFRNWPGDKGHINLPWNALSFVLDDQRYTCCYLDRPENPKESRYSERDYGRFGSYFEYDVTPAEPLKLNYRIWLQEGEMTVDQVNRLDGDFVSPPKVATK